MYLVDLQFAARREAERHASLVTERSAVSANVKGCAVVACVCTSQNDSEVKVLVRDMN